MASRSSVHRALLAALIVSVFLRALVPEGYMPGAGMLVELCASDGTRSVLLDPASGEVLDPGRGHAEPECPWQWLPGHALPPLHADPLSSLAAQGMPAVGLGHAAHSGSAARLPPARGPPPPARHRPV